MQRFGSTSVASSVVASGLVALSVMTTSGSAADLPAVKAPVLKAPAALWSWSGLYIGGHIGASLSITDIADPLGAPIYGDNVRSPGFIGGGQIGFNHQVGAVVFGVEADVSGSAPTAPIHALQFPEILSPAIAGFARICTRP